MTDNTSNPDDIGHLMGLARWAEPEPGQTTTADELRLHLLSEHNLAHALGLTDDQATTVHRQRHTPGLPAGHQAGQVLWNEDRINWLMVTHPRARDASLEQRWQAHYARVERANGGPLWTRPDPVVPDRDQGIYDHADVNENAAGELAALATARERLVAHFSGWAPRAAVAAADIVDELAREIIANCVEDEDLDDEIGKDEIDG